MELLSGADVIFRRDRVVVGASLAVLTLLAWGWIASGAGMGAPASAMTDLALFPHAAPGSAADAGGWPASAWLMVGAMWWVMMIGMMTPSAAPFVLLHARVWRHAALRGQADGKRPPTGMLVFGYLSVWLGFSCMATLAHWSLARAGLLSTMMSSHSSYLSALVLFVAGVYQFTPLKRACLVQCRNPVEMISHYWRPGVLGTFTMGWRHGVYCVGCCWALMLLLFVGGAMNLVWIALLALLVLLEKLSPAGVPAGKLAGSALMLWAVVTLFHGP